MTRFERLETLLSRAQATPSNERRHFLECECADDPTLFEEIWSMLNADSTDHETIGPYRIIDTIGRGGMGVVQLAERMEDYQQLVAIKRFHSDTGGDVISRFFREREALAKLEHPSIVRLLDGGTTVFGRPYLVMEYVAGGIQLDDYCCRHALPLKDRLRLFHSVCEAVQYAHGRLVVHRDLKPSNILVVDSTHNQAPHVKLVDFGLAKLVSPSSNEVGPNENMTLGPPRFTRGYASPEQLFGDPPDVRLDVYALGAILFRLLTFLPVPSFPATWAPLYSSPEDWIRAIYQSNPELPSTALSKQRTRPAYPPEQPKDLEGDLDSIVLKAMQPDAKNRYQTVQALADDIHAYLTSRPIMARPQSLGYRTLRFVQRFRWQVGTIGALALLTVLAMFWVAHTAHIETTLRREAELKRLEADEQRRRAQEQSRLAIAQQRAAEINESSAKQAQKRAEEQRAVADERSLAARAAAVPDALSTNPIEALRLAVDVSGDSLRMFRKLTPPIVRSLKLADDSAFERSEFFEPGGLGNDTTFLAISDNGLIKTVQTSGLTITFRVWTFESERVGQFETRFPMDNQKPGSKASQVKALALNPKGSGVAFLDEDGRIGVWSPESGALVGPWDTHRRSTAWLAYSNNRKFVAITEDGIMQLWGDDGHLISEHSIIHSGGITCVAISDDGKFVAAGGEDTSIRVLSTDDGRLIGKPLEASARSRVLRFSTTNGAIASGGDDGSVRVWTNWNSEYALAYPSNTFPGREGEITAVAFSPDDRVVASGSTIGPIHLWELNSTQTFIGSYSRTRTEKENNSTIVIRGHKQRVNALAFSRDGRFLASSAALGHGPLSSPDTDGAVRIWDTKGSLLTEGTVQDGVVTSMDLSPDGRLLVFATKNLSAGPKLQASEQAALQFRNAKGILIEGPIPTEGPTITAIKFGPDGRLLVAASRTGTLSLWNSHGKRIRTFETHSAGISGLGVGFQTVITVGADNEIRVWSFEGDLIRAWRTRGPGILRRIVVSDDGEELAAVRCTRNCESSGIIPETRDEWVSIQRYDNAGHPMGKPRTVFDAGDTKSFAMSPNGDYMALGQLDGFVMLSNGRWQRGSLAHDLPVTALKFNRGGDMLVSAGSDGKVRFFDADGEEFGMPFRYAHGRSRTAVGLAFSRDGNRLALAEDDGRFYIWTTDWFRIACDRLMNDPGFKKGYYPYAVSRIASVCK